MTPLVLLVGFLGSGKTTLLKNMVPRLSKQGLRPTVIINDYQNAKVDAEQLRVLGTEALPISGDCVCCGSREELIETLTSFQHTSDSIVLVETNGTTDSEQLIEMLSLEPGLKGFSPPIQVTIVDVPRWQKRFWHNQLEREQARTATHVFLSKVSDSNIKRLEEVLSSLEKHEIGGRRLSLDELIDDLVAIATSVRSEPERHFCSCEGHDHGHDHDEDCHNHDHGHDHQHHEHHHFASLELALPNEVARHDFDRMLKNLPRQVIRTKGLVRFKEQPGEFFVFQKVDRFDEPQFFPVGASPRVNVPLALFIGPQLHEGELAGLVDTLRPKSGVLH